MNPNTVIVQLSGGLLTSRDPSLAVRGDELEAADNAEYRPKDPGIWRVRGSAAFSSETFGTILNGKFLRFPGNPGIVMVTTAGLSETMSLRFAIMEHLTESLVLLESDLVKSDYLDNVYAGGENFLAFGEDRLRAVTSYGNVRLVSMLENEVAPTVNLSGGTGVGFGLALSDVIDYWIEERVKDATGTVILRRNIETGDSVIKVGGQGIYFQDGKVISPNKVRKYITGARGGTLSNSKLEVLRFFDITRAENAKPVITRPAVVNPESTHWALFGSGVDTKYPVGAELGEAPIGVTSIEDFRTGTSPGLPSGQLYEVVSSEILGVVQNVPKWAPAPRSNMLAMFKGIMVSNDLDNPGSLRWSYPGEYDAWPAMFQTNVGGREGQNITFIMVMGSQLLVGTDDGVIRFSRLPTPFDAAFAPDEIMEAVDGAHGGVAQDAAEIFSFGMGPLLAYVSPVGILATDSHRWLDLTRDVNWEALVEPTMLHRAKLVYNRKKHMLEFYYVPKGEVNPTKALYLQCHPSHVKHDEFGNPGPKITGPNDVDSYAAMKAFFNSQWYVITGARDELFYVADEGLTISSPEGFIGPAFKVRTTERYPAGFGNEFNANNTFLRHSAGAPGQKVTLTLIAKAEDQIDIPASRLVPLTQQQTSATQQDASGESMSIEITNSDSLGAFRLSYVGFEMFSDEFTERG